MRVLVGCECSGVVREAFRRRGHDAWSCDTKPAEDNSPYHFQADLLDCIKDDWDLMICHPPCTHLSCSGSQWWHKKRKRRKLAMDFVAKLMNCGIPKICLENPVGSISKAIGPPTQIIQPYHFGDPFQKTTCLWLIGLPKLIPTKIVGKGEFVTFASGKRMSKWYYESLRDKKNGQTNRSRTFPGIAEAMAEQWTTYNRPRGFGVVVPRRIKDDWKP